jgi:2,4-dienoyl-CoA reductase-like NADH-dependent reductase (Old Yellow Enzyme family)
VTEKARNPAPDPRYAPLFEPIRVGSQMLRSRVFASAHQPGLADDGAPGDRYVAYHRARARSGFAMQITGATPIVPSNLWDPRWMLVNRDESIVAGYQRLAEAVHEEGGRMLAQLMHPGAGEIGMPDIVSASVHTGEMTRQPARAITAAEMDEVVERYREAADRCRRGDLDGVEIPIAWGYLLGSFISPLMNRRDDEYAGSVENRLRFPLRVLRAVREAVGGDRLVGVRLVGDELVDGGLTVRDAPELARGLAAAGVVDYLNVISGTNMRRMSRVDHWPAAPAGTGIWRHLARAVRDAVDIPVCTVGRVNHPDIALDILASGDADLVGIARAHIVDPEFLQKTRSGRADDIRPCSAVNVCINALLHDEPIRCLANPEIGREGTIDESDVGAGRTAVVLGGGPGGIEAARRLAARGFAVRLYERGDALGGQMRIWTAAPARAEVHRLIGWWERDLARRGVDVRLGTEVTADVVVDDAPAIVVDAGGAVPIRHPWLVVDGRRVFDVSGLDAVPVGHVLVADEIGRADAMLLAEALTARGRRVTLATSCLHVGEDEGVSTLYPLLRELGQLGVELRERVRVTGFDGSTASLENQWDGRVTTVDRVDAILHWSGATPRSALAGELREAGLDVRTIGDARLARRVDDAVREAAELAWSLTLAVTS